MRGTPGSVSGTKIVLLEGGPPGVADRVEGILKTCTGRLERMCPASGEVIVYAQTDRTAEVEVEHRRRDGVVLQEKTAEVWEYVGYKEDGS